MVRSNPIQNNFNGGEISPLLKNRFDLQVYQNGLDKCRNFIPRVQGCLSRRPGTFFIKEVKDSDNRTHLQPFVFNNDEAFILEFGDQYIRFYKDRVAFEVSSTHYEIATPYLQDDLFDDKGIFRIKFTQSADIIYMVHPSYAPRKLLRNSNTDWTIEVVDADFPPFDDTNITDVTVYASATTGSITLTSSTGIFTTLDVGADFYIETNPNISTDRWQVATPYAENTVVRSGGNYYQGVSLTDGTTWTGNVNSGTITLSHIEGTESDGVINWEYLHSGYGYVEITEFSGATQVIATVKSRLPDNSVGSNNATTKWAFGAWNQTAGYPDNVVFFKERLVYSRDIKVWFSVVGDFDNFSLREGDVLADDMGINLTILSNKFNGIRWMYPLDDLILGTQGTIHIVSPNTRQQVFSASNIQSRSVLGRGSLPVPVVQLDNNILFVQRSGENMLSVSFDININNYNTTDLSLVSEHLFKGGVRLVAYQERPDNILWVVRTDGKVVALTINENQQVKGWHLHEFGGTDTVVESIAVIPSPDGDKDDVWLSIRRTVAANTVRYVEYMDQYFEQQEDTINAFFVDGGIKYNGTSTNIITGLDHLEGEVVDVLIDGATHPQRTVSGGQIELQRSGEVVSVGLNYQSLMKTNSFEAGAVRGTSVNRTKRINRVKVSFFESVQAKVGADEDSVKTVFFRKGSDFMNEAVPLFTGVKDVTSTDNYNEDSNITIIQDAPLPITILAITPEMATHER